MRVVIEEVWSSNAAAGLEEEEEAEDESSFRRDSKEAFESDVKWTVEPDPTSSSMWRYYEGRESESERRETERS